MPITLEKNDPKANVREQWFNEFVASIRVDELKLASGIASPEIQKAYDILMSGNLEEIIQETREKSTQYFVKRLIYNYITELEKRGHFPLKLAFDLSHAKVLVWAEININDNETEDSLFLTQAYINAESEERGFYIQTTVVESADELPLPPHYIKINLERTNAGVQQSR